MRLIAWNCCMGFTRKAPRLFGLQRALEGYLVAVAVCDQRGKSQLGTVLVAPMRIVEHCGGCRELKGRTMVAGASKSPQLLRLEGWAKHHPGRKRC